MALTIYRNTLKFYDSASGLGWSLTSYREAADADTVQTAAEAFLAKYFDCCFLTAQLAGLTVSNPDLPGGYAEYNPDQFIHQHGTATGGMCPLAEYMQACGDEPGSFVVNHAQWKLHGFDVSMLAVNGRIDVANASIVALKTAAQAWLYNYRKDPTPLPTATPPGFGWPAVSPPQPFAEFSIKGPAVRRLGSTFFVRGQHQRFKT